MSWSSLDIQIPGISTLQTLSSVAEQVTDILKDLQDLSLPLLTLANNLDNEIGVKNAALNAVATALLQSIEAYIQDVNGYALNIPLMESDKFFATQPDVPIRGLEDIAATMQLRYGDRSNNPTGNYSIYREIVESLYDQGDLNRPALVEGEESYALVLVYGATDFAKALKLSQLLDTLFAGTTPIGYAGYTLPLPSNSTARAIPTLAARSGRYAVYDLGDTNAGDVAYVLDEDAVAVRTAIEGNAGYDIIKVKADVYVKRHRRIEETDVLATYAVFSYEFEFEDNFIANTLYENNVQQVVITGLDPDVRYYVSKAYTYDVIDISTGVKTRIDPAFSGLGDQVLCYPSQQPVPTRVSRSTPPDWVATGTGTTLGGVNTVLKTLARELRTQLKVPTGVGNQLDALIALDTENIEKIRSGVEVVVNAVNNALSLVQQANEIKGLWVTSITTDGGTADFLRILGERLLDASTPNIPPFLVEDGTLGASVFMFQGGAGLTAVKNAVEGVFTSQQIPGIVIPPATPTQGAGTTSTTQTGTAKTLHDLGIGDPC